MTNQSLQIEPIRLTLFWSGIRATPYVFFFHAITMAATYPSARNFLFLAAYILNFLSNGGAKIVIRAIYEGLGVKSLPLLGLGMRPYGAANCGTFLKWPHTPAITYGMPSGHSQHAWFFATFMILELWRYYKNNCDNMDLENVHKCENNTDNIISRHPAMAICLASGLIIFAATVSYSRVWIEKCHTVQQVIVGGLFGTGLGFFAHYAISIILTII